MVAADKSGRNINFERFSSGRAHDKPHPLHYISSSIMSAVSPPIIAQRAFDRFVALHPFNYYTGILTLQAQAHFGVARHDPKVIAQVKSHLLPFVRGEVQFKCNFQNYLCGGNGAALLLQRGLLPEAADPVRFYAEELMRDAPRSREGIISNPLPPEPNRNWNREQIWIDAAFAVTPFLLYAGLAWREPTWIEEGFQQTKKMYDLFRAPENGLLHQCRGFSVPDRITEDHWSRGNGWGMIALTELVDALPADHPRRPEAEKMFHDLAEACLRWQNAEGLWHHEMTRPDSFVETSGSGLILHGLAIGVARGILPAAHRDRVAAGLRGYLRYIEPDGSIQNTCQDCRSPGDGTIAAYLQRKPIHNDRHGFGPVILAFGAGATRLGLETL